MPDQVIDTNVLLVASAADPYSPFGDSDLPIELQRQVFNWLVALRDDSTRRMVWDDKWLIFDEYTNKLTGQDFGLQVVAHKMATAQFVSVSYDDEGNAIVPKAFSRLDPSDRKMLAAVLTNKNTISLVNASDTDWLEIETALDRHGVTVEHILERWLRAKHAEKMRS